MRNGWTLTMEALTEDERVPDVYDRMAGVELEQRWVVRQYDTIVRTLASYRTEIDVRKVLSMDGIVPDTEVDWFDFLLHAEMLTVSLLTQPDTLPLEGLAA